MTPSPLTVGVVGLGYGRAHIPAFQAHGCRVVAVCQRDETAAHAVASAYGVPGVFGRWEEMLARARPDIVVIATPPHLHRPIAEGAFAAGAHVLCEKPLALTRAEAEAMTLAAERAGRVAVTGFNWRYPRAMERLHALVRAGALGRVFHIAARWLGGRAAAAAAPPTWRMDRALAGHGVMGDMGVHLVDLIRWSFGEFRQVVAQTGVAYPARDAPGGRPPDVEDYVELLAELDTGAQVTLTVSRAAHGVNEHTLEAYGTLGAVAYRLDRRGPTWYHGELSVAAAGSGLAPVALAPEAPLEGDPLELIGKATLAPLVELMLAEIRGGRGDAPSFRDGLAAQAVLDAARDSARGRRWATIEDRARRSSGCPGAG